ncbi:PEP-CTERM sorting domain-containing protein [Trichothermofontia sichuanensis B231]|uniref:PEP-CTERM sorting domain-containing protein n=1 Tax=Trichothermofontia sichuanensis TaxID=3045816 RepID=UPI0022453EB8|nr:PEP-CTERM sorting domain-containing protein [Trichothermofontia sichuanensis]UZQ52913.1 PEP-CTERM sorting domain-containing protein [Trichothermofontia sichuanensis B231]
MKRLSQHPIRHHRHPAFRLLALGVLGGAVVGLTAPASAQIFQNDGLSQSTSSQPDTSYYDSLYAGYDSYSGEASTGTYGTEGVPEPTILAGLILAGVGFTYLRHYQPQKV